MAARQTAQAVRLAQSRTVTCETGAVRVGRRSLQESQKTPLTLVSRLLR